MNNFTFQSDWCPSQQKKDSSGGSSCMCRGYGVSCLLVVGGDFSVSSTISHRELVKSSACRLPALISWIVKMCFSAAVIIILGTQAQTNPLNCTLREREWERQKRSSDCTYVCISTTVPFEGKTREKDAMLWKSMRGEKKTTQANITFLKCLFIE